ncbi:unnamed protein product, partial [Alopecurus aequalis]
EEPSNSQETIMATNQLSIKLLINNETNKLCFAEADRDVVEFLTALLSLPLGTITSLLTKESMPGSVGTLLGSAEKLDVNYNSKERHLSPSVAPNTLSCLQQLLGSHLSNGNCNDHKSRSSMASNQLWIKLLINKKTGKLCFAEAGSDVVQFLKGLLSLPLGTVTGLLAEEGMVGSVGTLLGSVEKLGANYNIKDQQLSPAVAPATLSRLQHLLGAQISVAQKLHRCTYNYRTTCGSYASASWGSACPGCGGAMTIATIGTHGPVAAAAVAPTTLPTPTYMIKDDLSVTPESMSVITMLAECGVNELSVLQQKIVKIGREE